MSKLCQSCHHENLDIAIYCAKCGSKFIVKNVDKKKVNILQIFIWIIVALFFLLTLSTIITKEILQSEKNDSISEDIKPIKVEKILVVEKNKTIEKEMKNIIKKVTVVNQKYSYYENSRFGFSLEYPQKVFTEKNYPTNGDGVWLSNKNNTVKLTSSASFKIDNQTIKEIFIDSLKAFKKNKNIEVTYKVQKKNWYVISGYNYSEKIIFYQKYYLIKDVFSGFAISCPIKEKNKYSKTIESVSKSFHPSYGEN